MGREWAAADADLVADVGWEVSIVTLMDGRGIESFSDVRELLGLSDDETPTVDEMLARVDAQLEALQTDPSPDHHRWVAARAFLKDSGRGELVKVPKAFLDRIAPNPETPIREDHERLEAKHQREYHGRLIPPGVGFAVLMFLSDQLSGVTLEWALGGIQASLVAQAVLVMLAAAVWMVERRRHLRLEGITRDAFDVRNHGRVLDELESAAVAFDVDEFARRLEDEVLGSAWKDSTSKPWRLRQDVRDVFDQAAAAAIERFRLRGWLTVEPGSGYTEFYRAVPRPQLPHEPST